MTVSIPAAYLHNTCGLCGTFDNDKSNEYRLKNGSLVSKNILVLNQMF